VSTKNSVDQYFQNFNIDENKAEVNYNVKEAGNYSSSGHFGLPQRNKAKGSPTLSLAVTAVNVAAKLNIAPNAAKAATEKENGSSQYNDENDVL
jgi:hypothetical protein